MTQIPVGKMNSEANNIKFPCDQCSVRRRMFLRTSSWSSRAPLCVRQFCRNSAADANVSTKAEESLFNKIFPASMKVPLEKFSNDTTAAMLLQCFGVAKNTFTVVPERGRLPTMSIALQVPQCMCWFPWFPYWHSSQKKMGMQGSA